MRFQSEKVKIVRKTWHILAGLFFPIIYLYLTKPQIIILVGAVFLTFLTLEGLRLRNPKLNRWFIKKIGNYLKDKERKNLTSNTFYVASALLAVIFFDLYDLEIFIYKNFLILNSIIFHKENK